MSLKSLLLKYQSVSIVVVTGSTLEMPVSCIIPWHGADGKEYCRSVVNLMKRERNLSEVKYKAVLIDVDNTLLDFDEYVRTTMKDGFEHFGIGPYESWMYDAFHEENNKLWKALERQELTFEDIKRDRWNIVFRRLGINFDGPVFEKYFRSRIYDSAIPIEGSLELLQFLKGRTIVCSASNGPYEQQIHRLGIPHFSDYMDFNFISEDIGVSKPAKEFFDEALHRIEMKTGCRILPKDCLMIGDSLTSDIAGGINCGMDTCFFDKSGNGLPSDLPENRRPDFHVRSLKDIQGVINAQE